MSALSDTASGVLSGLAAIGVTVALAMSNQPTPVAAASQLYELAIDEVAGGLSHPWGIAFLPDGGFLVTERGGRLNLFDDAGRRIAVAGVPAVAAQGQGGLLDVALDPAFTGNRRVYLSYAEAGAGGAGTAVARGALRVGDGGARLDDVEVIFRQEPKVASGQHFGSRLVFARDGTLFVTLGERGQGEPAQDPTNHIGTIVRINPDGSIPADNPFAGGGGGRPEIYSIGHRNVQGADLDVNGRLITVEHGARGGDEINFPEPGKNYGWPTISYGRHYTGGRIGVGTAAPGLEQPVHYWDPSIAPSGLAVYDGDLFSEWRGDILVGALRAQLLTRLEMSGGRVTREERMLEGELGRIRDVEVGPDGAVYLLTDKDSGGVYRLTPAAD